MIWAHTLRVLRAGGVLLLAGCALPLPPRFESPEDARVAARVIRVEGFGYLDQVLVEERVGVSSAFGTGSASAIGAGGVVAGTAHASAFGTSAEQRYQTVTMSDRRAQMIHQLENIGVAEFVVAEGPADYLVQGTRAWANGDLDKFSTFPVKLLLALTLTPLVGMPVPEHAGAEIVARVYDGDGHFLTEFREEHELLYSTTLFTFRRDESRRARELSERAIERLAVRVAKFIGERERERSRRAAPSASP